MPYLGGHQLTSLRWVGSTALAATFTAPADGLFRQLYAGRTMIGVASHPSDREIVGQLAPSRHPQLISLIAVTAAERLTDFGDKLGVSPWNRAQLRLSVSSMAADAERIEITAGTEPGGAVDPTNVLGNIPLEGDGEYDYITTPMQGGTWNLEAIPYDSRGNAGTPLATSIDLVSFPPDVVLQADQSRIFGVSIAGQVLSISVVLQ